MSKTAIITGGATGIGAATSTLLASEGYNIVIAYNKSEEKAFKLSEEINRNGGNSVTCNVNVSDITSIENLFKFTKDTFGSVDIVVSNAGVAQQKQINDITPEDLNNMLSVNLIGCFNCCKIATQYMLIQHSGCIINITSMWGIAGASCESHYSAAKAGIIGLTKSLAKELGPSGIRVNAVAPGVIQTDMLSSFTQEDLQTLAYDTPLSRLGTPWDVANAVSFLASDKASFITGQILSVDGGFIL